MDWEVNIRDKSDSPLHRHFFLSKDILWFFCIRLGTLRLLIVDKLLVKDLWRPESPITETMAGGSYRRLIFLLSQTQSKQYRHTGGENTQVLSWLCAAKNSDDFSWRTGLANLYIAHIFQKISLAWLNMHRHCSELWFLSILIQILHSHNSTECHALMTAVWIHKFSLIWFYALGLPQFPRWRP